MHRGEDIRLAANKPHVERVSWNTARSARHHRKNGQAGFMLVMSPKQRKEDVSQQDIAHYYAGQNVQPSSFHGTNFFKLLSAVSLRLQSITEWVRSGRRGHSSNSHRGKLRTA